MEHLLLTRQADAIALTNMGILSRFGRVVLPFSELNPTYHDMLDTFVRKVCSTNFYRELCAASPVRAVDSIKTLNVFTSVEYKSFLQMICREHEIDKNETRVTTSFDVLVGEHCKAMRKEDFPVIRNTREGVKLFDNIELTTYGKLKIANSWLVVTTTKITTRGILSTLQEYNVFLAERDYVGG